MLWYPGEKNNNAFQTKIKTSVSVKCGDLWKEVAGRLEQFSFQNQRKIVLTLVQVQIRHKDRLTLRQLVTLLDTSCQVVSKNLGNLVASAVSVDFGVARYIPEDSSFTEPLI